MLAWSACGSKVAVKEENAVSNRTKLTTSRAYESNGNGEVISVAFVLGGRTFPRQKREPEPFKVQSYYKYSKTQIYERVCR